MESIETIKVNGMEIGYTILPCSQGVRASIIKFHSYKSKYLQDERMALDLINKTFGSFFGKRVNGQDYLNAIEWVKVQLDNIKDSNSILNQ
jgi:hypothetical protein